MIPRHSWTPRELSASLGVPYDTVLGLIHSGELGHIKAGRYYLVPDVELRRYLAQGVQSAETPRAPGPQRITQPQ